MPGLTMPQVPLPVCESNMVAYLAPPGFESQLITELGPQVEAVYDRLVLARLPEKPVAWAANIWLEPQLIPISSIGDGAKKLRALQRNWALYSFSHHRRAALIAEKLPKVSAKPLVFGSPKPQAPLGSWTLLDADTILCSPRCSSAFPHGEVAFVEDHLNAPSRAYLKLWETFTLLGTQPQPGDFCVDLGACPGGWTWVLQQLGARILSVDKAPLDDRLMNSSQVEYRAESAFALDPKTIGQVDWLFSDIICYPSRLLTLIQKWLDAGTVRHFVCTIKFQGETDFDTLAKLAEIPGSQIIHLHHNKHELTWLHI